jgi:MarR family transcriptional regulator for hemolysin
VLQYDFEDSIGYWLIRASQAYERAIKTELAPRGITFRQGQVLALLAMEGDLSQAELAEKMHIEPPTLVGVLDRMERDGWITRHDCPGDRRKKLVRPASQAEPVWSEIVSCALRVRARAAGDISDEQMQVLKDLLQRVVANLSAESAVGESVR